MAEQDGSTVRRIRRWERGRHDIIDDRLAVEEPLEIRLGDEPLAVTMRTPGHDIDLAAGFCLTEGIVVHADEVESITPCAQAEHGNVILVDLTEEALGRRCDQVARARRETYLSSSCGLCGKRSIERIHQRLPQPVRGDFQIERGVIGKWPGIMREAQSTFEQTGGLHAAAIFSAGCALLVLREDVGRHNAVDKVIGHQLMLGKLPLGDAALLVSGRSSFEIMQKAAMAGIALVAAVSAPSSLAVDFAQKSGQTLVGFLRDGRMNIYNDRIENPRLV